VTTTGTPPDPHADDRIDELLAGYALRSLSGEDAAEADRLLSEHVPDCGRCRETLLAFSETVADLALGADPLPPPDTLLPRLHRELEPGTARQTPGRWAVVASGVAAILVVGGVAVSMGMRAGNLQTSNDLLRDALAFSQRPGASTEPLGASALASPAPVSEITAPDEDHFFLIGEDVPEPPAGLVYGIWLSDGTDLIFAGTFVPRQEMTVVDVPFDRSRFDRVVITLEVDGVVEPTAPGEAVWEAAA
jgi:hypothetical protein